MEYLNAERERLTYLRSTNLKAIVNSEVRNSTDVLQARIHDLPINLLSALATVQPLLDLLLLQSRLGTGFNQDLMRRDVFLILKVRIKQLLNNACLYLRALRLAQLHKSVRITGISRLAAELEADALVLAYFGEHLVDSVCALLAKLLDVRLPLVEALAGIRVQVEGKPLCGECVVGLWVLLLVCCNAFFEALFANITPCCGDC